jgi:AraC-like DNA-binding protein
MMLGVRTWGNDADADSSCWSGSYESTAAIGDRLRNVLPPILWVKHDEWDSPLLDLLNSEMERDAPGQAAVLDRLLDMLLIAILRKWLDSRETQNSALVSGQGGPGHQPGSQDAAPGAFLRVDLDSLAAKVGLSRAALARRFHEVVGEPPMTFLTQWRLALAADLLAEPELTLESIAEQVGYSSAFALSSAFKRVRGLSPKEHRAQLAG